MPFDSKIDNITAESQHIVDEFLGYYTFPNSYGGMIKKIQKKLNITDFKKLTYGNYIEIMSQYQQGASNYKYADSFFRYLYAFDLLDCSDEFILTYGDKTKIIKEFKRLQNKEGSDKKSDFSAPTLSFYEIEKLIKYCDEVGEAIDFTSYSCLRSAFAFYILFFVGKKRDEFAKCTMSGYDNGILEIAGEIIEIPPKFKSMFEYARQKNKETKFSEVTKWISKLGSYVNIEQLTPIKISHAREEYLFRCPACGKSFLSLSENWKIVNGKIICNECAGILLSDEVKKNEQSQFEVVEVDLLDETEKDRIHLYVSSYEQMRDTVKAPCDFEEWNKYLKKIGEMGEKYVFTFEVQKLLDAGREDLAEQVDASVSEDHTNGYDILSYTIDGKKLFIEVKSTPGTKEEPFYISKNELDRAKELKRKGELYAIYRVYNVGKSEINMHIFIDIDKFDFEEIAYKVSISDDKLNGA